MKSLIYDLEIGVRATLSMLKRPGSRRSGPVDLFLCIADHFEPRVGGADREKARNRVEDWVCRYPAIAGRYRDWEGHPPAHTFFYPWDEFDAWEFEKLVQLSAAGWGEIELHLHHRDDTSDSLRSKLREAIACFRREGALSQWPDGRPAWGFVHGNWSLDNSRVEDGRNFCGVNDELTILEEEGCFADFTFPAWQKECQPRQVNSLYYAIDDPQRPKSYDRGTPVRVGGDRSRRGLMMIQGPLTPYLERGGPRMDDGDLAASPARRFNASRLSRWVKAGISVLGCDSRIFVKLHCHGAEDRNREALLGGDLEALFSTAAERWNDGARFRTHHVTARELYNVVRATEAGAEGSIEAARDWVLPPPSSRSKGSAVTFQRRPTSNP